MQYPKPLKSINNSEFHEIKKAYNVNPDEQDLEEKETETTPTKKAPAKKVAFKSAEKSSPVKKASPSPKKRLKRRLKRRLD